MKKLALILFTVLTFCALNAQAQTTTTTAPTTAADPREAIKQTVLDYAEGWYEGNAERMERALHPDLAKRIVRNDDKGNSRLDNMGALTLVQGTRRGFGKQTPKEQQQKDVTILDMMENSAVVKLEMRDWVDYMQLGKIGGRWVIVNVLWEMKPPKKSS
ncbi:MAG TPA: nuclear transport factor 2 family protein [Pyrinomonadaceae bacterium]|nr:nuclear transport factor 2 family protein [Pyrinomonadaceae bacterium]